jgi:hypothetical protein
MMADQLSVPQILALIQVASGPLIVIRTIGNAGWAIPGERKRFCSTQTIRTLEGHGLVTINGGKASITARGKRFLEAEGK